MPVKLSFRAESIQPSAIRRYFDVPEDVVSLGIGEPDFSSPDCVVQAAVAGLQGSETHYTANLGISGLRTAISDHLFNLYGVRYDPDDEIIVTVGCSEALFLALAATVNPGDEVIVITPCFVSYQAAVYLASGIPVEIPCTIENDFDLDVATVEAAITPKTRAILFGFPCNPTGAVASREALTRLTRLALKYDLAMISDELYDQLVFEGEHVCASSIPGAFDRTFLVGGFSKNYAMTGFRIGYICGPRDLLNGAYKIHQYLIMSAPTLAQLGAIAALKDGAEDVVRMRNEYDRRRKLLYKTLNEFGLRTAEPKGAFYIFPEIRSTGLTSEAFAGRLLNEKRVALIPGNGFGKGGEGFVRISYATAYEKIEIALERIRSFLKDL